jgi:hypothetical protein
MARDAFDDLAALRTAPSAAIAPRGAPWSAVTIAAPSDHRDDVIAAKNNF